MQRVLRSLFVCLFAGALVFNGGALRVLAGTPAAQSHHVAVASVDAGHQDQYEARHFAGADNATVVIDHAPGHDHINGASKCCTMCIAFDNLMPAFVAAASQFHYRAILFKVGRENLVGHLVALDPDIPKTIV